MLCYFVCFLFFLNYTGSFGSNGQSSCGFAQDAVHRFREPLRFCRQFKHVRFIMVGFLVLFYYHTDVFAFVFVVFAFVCSHIGAQLSHSANPDAGKEGEAVPIIHVKYPELIRRVEAGRTCRRRFVGGVMPDIVVRHWKQLGYSVRSGAQVR